MQGFKLVAQRISQGLRLMVGVQDYDRYVEHMQLKHPELTPMTRAEFYRAAIDNRYPGKSGKISKCPC
ncbi:YbdD/YjiX family protein [Chitinibacter bivalviorum]|uniref:YbdD/YjiX family protein n=1 Tax=Chitinibacter bivalviorum TaxID=2739434 RepID=A0A7H9BEF1_9NEIS|nr:YbdD/YjiX family protein [Chitinibacter bivalviorum]QLG86975.1 YbdD/YjiX family protein [Chitinibacter bivalviorum]